MLWDKYTQQKNGGNIYNARNCGISINMKIPKNSENKLRGLYFSRALFEGLIYGGRFAFQNRLG